MEDPREYGLTADDLRIAADRLYQPGDWRMDDTEDTPAEAQYDRIRSALRALADALDGGDGEKTPPPPCRHDRIPLATQRAALRVARHVVNGDNQAAIDAAADAECATCLALCSVHLGVGMAAELSGHNGFPMSDTLRRQLLAAIEMTERGLGESFN